MFPRKCQVRSFRCATVELYSGKIIVWINNLVVFCRRVRSHCPKNNMNLCLKPSLSRMVQLKQRMDSPAFMVASAPSVRGSDFLGQCGPYSHVVFPSHYTPHTVIPKVNQFNRLYCTVLESQNQCSGAEITVFSFGSGSTFWIFPFVWLRLHFSLTVFWLRLHFSLILAPAPLFPLYFGSGSTFPLIFWLRLHLQLQPYIGTLNVPCNSKVKKKMS